MPTKPGEYQNIAIPKGKDTIKILKSCVREMRKSDPRTVPQWYATDKALRMLYKELTGKDWGDG